MMTLTRAQAGLFNFIVAFIEEGGYAPTYEEMQAHTGDASKSGIYRLLLGLEERGAIRRLSGRARAIEVLPSRHLLAAVSDAALLAEVQRRGLHV